MATHVRVLAVLGLVGGTLGLLAGAALTVLFGVLGGFLRADHDTDAAIGLALVGLTGGALLVVVFSLSITALLCGWGLYKRRRWGRTLSIIFAAVLLIQFPVGTAIGIYALWVLFNKQTEPLFGVGEAPASGAR